MQTRLKPAVCRSSRSTSSWLLRKSSANYRKTCKPRSSSWFNGASDARPTPGVICRRDTMIRWGRGTRWSHHRGRRNLAAGNRRQAIINNSKRPTSRNKNIFNLFHLRKFNVFSFETFKLFHSTNAWNEILHRTKKKNVVKVRQSKITEQLAATGKWREKLCKGKKLSSKN